jgi:hypothetical protein
MRCAEFEFGNNFGAKVVWHAAWGSERGMAGAHAIGSLHPCAVGRVSHGIAVLTFQTTNVRRVLLN